MIYKVWEHKSWGNAIQLIGKDLEAPEIAGHLLRRPVEGDEIQFKMNSGKVARYSVKSAEHCEDPPDMFFAKLEFIDYVE